MTLIMISLFFFIFDTQLESLKLLGGGMVNPDICGGLTFDLHLFQMYTTGYFLPSQPECRQRLYGLIEICDSTGHSGPLDECPWALWVPFITFGWLAVPGWCEPGLVQLFMTLSIWHQVYLCYSGPMHCMSLECAANDNSSRWQENFGFSHFTPTWRTWQTDIMANTVISFQK